MVLEDSIPMITNNNEFQPICWNLYLGELALVVDLHQLCLFLLEHLQARNVVLLHGYIIGQKNILQPCLLCELLVYGQLFLRLVNYSIIKTYFIN